MKKAETDNRRKVSREREYNIPKFIAPGLQRSLNISSVSEISLKNV